MRIAFVGNQGGLDVVTMWARMARILADEFDADARLVVWLERERNAAADLGIQDADTSSFEEYVRRTPPADAADVDRLVRDYREVNWSEVVAAERTFTDYSMLLGGAGDRRETPAYVQRLVTAIVRYLESVMAGCDAVVCQTADSLFSLIVFKVADHLKLPVFAITPAWLLEPGSGGGGFFANTAFLECHRMTAAFRARSGRALTSDERARCVALVDSMLRFDGKKSFYARTKGASGRRALTPNLVRLPSYLIENLNRDKNVEYIKIEPWLKVRANVLRLARKWRMRTLVGPPTVDAIPSRSVFYALHFQPEQSTLAQGIWQVNQVALVENISKSLPLGYTLVVKEHPWGRGNRPPWQYQHMAGLYNVLFCDAPAKEIIKRVDAVVSVTGTVAVESLVLDKPTILLGRNFFEFADLFYRVRDIQDLPEVLARILIDGDYDRQPNREHRRDQFLMAYLDGLIPAFPSPEHAATWARALAGELALVPNATRLTRVGSA